MKKYIYLVLFWTFFLVGCVKSNEEDEFVIKIRDIKNVTSDYQDDIEKILKTDKYDNLFFDSNCIWCDIKTEGSFCNIYSLKNSENDAFLNNIEKMISGSEYADYYDRETDLFALLHDLYTEEDPRYHDNHLYLVNSLSDNAASNIDEYIIHSKMFTMDCYGGGVSYFCNRTLYELNPCENGDDVYFRLQPFRYFDSVVKEYSYIYKTNDEIESFENEKYSLYDGQISVAEAKSFIEERIENLIISNDDKRNFYINGVSIYNIADKNAFAIAIIPKYDGLPILSDKVRNCLNMEFYPTSGSTVYIAKKNEISAFTAFPDVMFETSEEIIEAYGVREAVALTSEQLSGLVNFCVKSVEFGYTKVEMGNNYRLGWLFSGYNDTRGEAMSVFVDAVSGKVYVNAGE